MSIRNASIPLGATYTPTGGTATPLMLLSANNTEVKTFVATTGVTPLTRTEVSFFGKPPKVSASAPGGFTQGRSGFTVSQPKVLTNLKRTLNTAGVTFNIDPETTEAEANALKSLLLTLINDTDFVQLFLNQSVD